MRSQRSYSILVAAIVNTIVCSPTIVTAQICDEYEKLVTATPAPPNDANGWRIYTKERSLAIRANVDLVLVGDSLAEAWDTTMWSPMRVINLGVGGDRTQNVLWQLSSTVWSRLKPGRVLIMLGTNNLSAGDKPCAIVSGLTKVIKRVHAMWPSTQIGFLEIPPRGQNFLFQNDARMQVNAALRLDPSVRAINVDDTISCGWKQPCTNYASDNLHFSDNGYQVLQKSVKERLV